MLTGDLHSFIAGYLTGDFDDPAEVDYDGVCFMAGSVTSSNLAEIGTDGVGFPGPGVTDPEAYKASNPHITSFNSETHGYNVVEVTPDLLTCWMVSVHPIKEGAASTRNSRANVHRPPRPVRDSGGCLGGPRRADSDLWIPAT